MEEVTTKYNSKTNVKCGVGAVMTIIFVGIDSKVT